MSTIVMELYDALIAAGASEAQARAAASAVMDGGTRSELVTKADLRTEIAELKAELIKWNVGAIISVTAIFAAIVKLL